ncbi:MAG: DUF6141 family protein [Methanomicrobiales archaeon]|nr:DUF6141 family protein [Methanomicrobiales archaeon]
MSGRTSDEDIRFSEEQRFRQFWILIILSFIAAIAWYAFIQQILMGEPFGDHPVTDIVVLIVLAIFGMLIPLLFLLLRLEIQVTRNSLRFRMYPFHLTWRIFPFGSIADVEAVRYRPLLDYGGWGIRIGRKGWAYNVSGDEGVQITLKSGRSFLLGSGRAEELAGVLQSQLHRTGSQAEGP